jgi:hypothetical protein
MAAVKVRDLHKTEAVEFVCHDGSQVDLFAAALDWLRFREQLGPMVNVVAVHVTNEYEYSSRNVPEPPLREVLTLYYEEAG